MGKGLAILAAVVLTGCSNAPQPPRIVSEPHCTTPTERAALAQFVVDCSKAANPLSDEEGEDLVAQCQSTGTDVLCPTHQHRKTFVDEPMTWRVDETEPTHDQ